MQIVIVLKNFDLQAGYLGVIVDEKLTWKEHCKQLCCNLLYPDMSV